MSGWNTRGDGGTEGNKGRGFGQEGVVTTLASPALLTWHKTSEASFYFGGFVFYACFFLCFFF